MVSVFVDGKKVQPEEAMSRLADAWNIINDHREQIKELQKEIGMRDLVERYELWCMDKLENCPTSEEFAARIRELEADIETIKRAHSDMTTDCVAWKERAEKAETERARLSEINKEMAKALKDYLDLFQTMANGLEVSAAEMAIARDKMRAALAKATEKTG